MEDWTTIRNLHAKGLGIRAIARQLGLARNTVREALRSTAPPKYQRTETVNPKLEPFLASIRTMIERDRLIGSRILTEISKLGYRGSRSAFYRAYARIHEDVAPSRRATERFETGPGVQGQFDWSPYTLNIGGEMRRVVVFDLVLGYSRRKFFWPSLDETQGSIFEAIEEALWHFGGAPKELLVDRARSFVKTPHPDHFEWNPRFLALCGHYRMAPVACEGGRPQTKGKVERPFYFLEQHLLKGNAFDSLDHLTAALRRYSLGLDSVVHSTTREMPGERFEREKDALTQLPDGRWVGVHETFRKVSWDGIVSFDGARYHVPWRFAGKQVWIRECQGARVRVFSLAGEPLVTWDKAGKGETRINPQFYDGLRRGSPRTAPLLQDDFRKRFPEDGLFLEKLLAQYRASPVRPLRAILELADHHPHAEMRCAFGLALQYNTFSATFIKGVLDQFERPAEVPVGAVNSVHHVPRLNVRRNLRDYGRFLEGGAGR